MAIIPIVRCSQMAASLRFYSEVLGFELDEAGADTDDPCFNVLRRGADVLFLSSHSGDGEFGQAVVVLTDDVNALFHELLSRGYRTPGKPDSPVHEHPTDQTWGTRELYVDDPDGNTIRFVQSRPSR